MKTIKAIRQEHGRTYSLGYNQCREDVLELIDEMIKNYRTLYGVKKETVIQSAFIYELEELKKRITG